MTLAPSRKINRTVSQKGKKKLRRRTQEQKTLRALLASEGYRLQGIFEEVEGRSKKMNRVQVCPLWLQFWERCHLLIMKKTFKLTQIELKSLPILTLAYYREHSRIGLFFFFFPRISANIMTKALVWQPFN